jgi:predicted transcriptional regulator
MKTLTISISDEAAQGLEQAVAGSTRTVEEVAARTVEGAFSPEWGELDAEDIAAIEEGLADFERGAVATDEEVEEAFARFQR